MPKQYKFVVDANTITMFEEHGSEFRLEPLKLNQTISFDAASGDITLVTHQSSYIETEVFHRTPDTTDDPSLYDNGEDAFTDLLGNPIAAPVDHSANDDNIDGTGGVDDKHGGLGDDNIYGLGGDDTLHGDSGDDYVVGGGGNDDVSGDDGYDALYGNDGADHLSGGGADDILNGGNGADLLEGGSGNDRISGGADNDRSDGGTGDDSIDGGTGDDNLSGGSGNDLVRGGSGRDVLAGGVGNDRLDGSSGVDYLRGGSGRDVMTGGDDGDRYIFDDGDFGGKTGLTADRITDFSQAQGDKINLAPTDANTTLDGDQAFTFIGTGAFTHTAGELRYQQSGSDTYVLGDQNGDSLVDFAIKVDGLVAFTAGDFIL